MLAAGDCLTDVRSAGESCKYYKIIWSSFLNGEENTFKWSYLMIFVRVLVAVSVRWCKVYAWKQKWLRLVFIGANGI